MKTIKLKFIGKNWNKLKPGEIPFPFDKILSEYFHVESSNEPDFVISKESLNFYADCLQKHPHAPVRILFAGEALVPDFNIFDYAIGFDRIDFGDRYFRIGTKNFFSAFDDTIDLAPKATDPSAPDRKFCNFIYSNSSSNNMRRDLFTQFSAYRHVDAAGALMRNTDFLIETGANWCRSKLDFQSGYKFTLAIENSKYRGYTTEKLLHPMSAQSIPIYWGNEDVGKEFNTKSFINCHDYNHIDDVVAAVKKLDQTPDLYQQMLNEPWQTEEQIAQSEKNAAAFRDFVLNIFNKNVGDARRRGDGTWVWRYENTLRQRIKLHEKHSNSFPHRLSRRLQKWGLKK